MTNPYPEGTGEHLLFAIFGELPGPDACECGMPTECPPPPNAFPWADQIGDAVGGWDE